MWWLIDCTNTVGELPCSQLHYIRRLLTQDLVSCIQEAQQTNGGTSRDGETTTVPGTAVEGETSKPKNQRATLAPATCFLSTTLMFSRRSHDQPQGMNWAVRNVGTTVATAGQCTDRLGLERT
jgi:hypothetical protein